MKFIHEGEFRFSRGGGAQNPKVEGRTYIILSFLTNLKVGTYGEGMICNCSFN